jgi:hypothetical protein
MEQPPLWTDDPAPVDDRPRCAMCARPARRNTRTGETHRYCDGKHCGNRDRICQTCDGPFTIGIDGAGTKYCSARCKHLGYTIAHRQKPTPLPTCAWCGKPATQTPTGTTWPYVCSTCTEPIRHLTQRLRRHRVPHHLAQRLITDPTCEICGVDIVTKIKHPITGRVGSLLVVDHDHDCCPGAHSCGECVRGLICQMCNNALGFARNDTTILHGMLTYLAVHGDEDDA